MQRFHGDAPPLKQLTTPRNLHKKFLNNFETRQHHWKQHFLKKNETVSNPQPLTSYSDRCPPKSHRNLAPPTQRSPSADTPTPQPASLHHQGGEGCEREKEWHGYLHHRVEPETRRRDGGGMRPATTAAAAAPARGEG